MRCLLAPVLAFSWLLGTGAPALAGDHVPGPEIWYTPNPNSATADFNSMWTDDAPWQHAAKKVNVLGIDHSWVLSASDAQILAVTDFAKRHHMKLDMDVEVVMRNPAPACGQIEGYIWPTAFPDAMATLQRLNVQLDYLNMDEPLWDGHYITSANGGCALSVSDLVANVASTIAPVIAQYPNIQIYEIEPVPPLTNMADWRETLNDFEVGLSQAIGRPIRGLNLDMTWDTPIWIQPLQDLRTFTHQRNLRLGWYFDATSYVMSDAQWLESAATNFEYVEGTLHIIPDIGLVASWNPYPAHNLPETWPIGLTSVIDYYFKQRTTLQVQFTGRGATGRLTTLEDGKPVVNATVNGYLPGANFTQPLPANVIQGVVPPTAAFALVGYRLNMECSCAGINDVLIGTIHYQETQGGSANYTYLMPDQDVTYNGPPYNGTMVTNETVGGTIVNRIITTPTQSFGVNSTMIPVDPGASFTYTFPAATMGSGPWYGHAFLSWFDHNMNGLPGSYTFVPPTGQTLVSTATTALDGSFTLTPLPRVGPGSAPVTAQYLGDATHRPVTWSQSP
jgi:hypothetical protein